MAEEKGAKKAAKKAIRPYTPAAKFCSKCGSRMADHENRFACGMCGYTEWKGKSR